MHLADRSRRDRLGLEVREAVARPRLEILLDHPLDRLERHGLGVVLQAGQDLLELRPDLFGYEAGSTADSVCPALGEIDLAALHLAEHGEAVLDQAWRKFTSPQALAAAQLWIAAWSEPELGDAVSRPRRGPSLPALIGAAVSLIRGLVMAIPISGREAIDARWEASKPLLLEAAAQLLDEPHSA